MGNPRTVLVVDDDPSLRRMLRLILAGSGFRICFAEDGAIALDELARCEPDVILLDLRMPTMDGRAFCREMRNRGSKTPVIVVSANEAAAAARELSAAGYVAKPFDPDALAAKVAAIAG